MRKALLAGCTWLLLCGMAPAIAAEAESGDVDARVQDLYAQAKSAQAHGDLPGAVAKYEQILRISPRLGPAYNNLGALYFRQRDYAKAADILEKGLKINPAMPSATALLGIAQFEMGDAAKARPYLEAALKANPNDANAQMYLVKCLMKLGDYESASSQLQKLAARQEKNQEVWFLLAKVYMKLSEQSLIKMNSIDPNSVLAHELSGEMMEAMNNYDGALVELKKAVELGPKQPGAHYQLGDAYWALSKWDSAADEFQAELNVDPANCMAKWKLADITLQKNGSPEDALARIDKALAMCPTLTDARADRARALMKLGRNAEAVTDLQTAVQADPSDPTNHFLLAKAYRALGRAQEAQAETQVFSKLEETARAATAERAQEVIENKETAH